MVAAGGTCLVSCNCFCVGKSGCICTCMCMCVYMCVCVYVYVCVHVCTYVCVCMSACVCTFVHSKAINSPGRPVHPIYITLLDKRKANEQSHVTGCD